ncbi:hypothetical protein N7519_011614 [Penicillium mononematosum]|uniref:uncharacterized protein n=1 Tax=Penicillium mononematosum TaxID=268346 RepID=UPI0025475000|nr:uncharacterized protein N7519_011614 [Penicillium mononematosum]KAJ6181153.1 hypothetical protein N7519_011614 [Penicillium mononematosum]
MPENSSSALELDPRIPERLSRLEGIIKQFGVAAQENHQAQETSHAREASETHPFDLDFSRLKVDESKSYYVNNALWVTLSNEVEELRDLLFERASEDNVRDPTLSTHFSHYLSTNSTAASCPPSQLGLNAAIFGYRAITSALQNFHPSLTQAVTLFAAFTENVAPLVRIFRMPTLTHVYWDAIASLDSLDKHTETLIFSTHYSAVSREAALERYRFAVEQALARGNLLNTQRMIMLQAAVLFLSALPNKDDSRAAWSLTWLIYHIARTMGLHRDGTVLGLKPFETEFPETPESIGQLERNMRDELFQNSIQILEVSDMLLTNKDIMKWSWNSTTYIQWAAMAFVLSELCARSRSPECHRALDCVTTVYDAWKVSGDQEDESRLALWRPIRRLMAKARYLSMHRCLVDTDASTGNSPKMSDSGLCDHARLE